MILIIDNIDIDCYVYLQVTTILNIQYSQFIPAGFYQRGQYLHIAVFLQREILQVCQLADMTGEFRGSFTLELKPQIVSRTEGQQNQTDLDWYPGASIARADDENLQSSKERNHLHTIKHVQ